MIRLFDLLTEKAKRDYKAEYKKYQSSPKMRKYRSELNKYNRKKGTYGNGDGKDASHKGGKIVGFEAESKNRGRREKSRLKKEASYVGNMGMMELVDFQDKASPAEKKELQRLMDRKQFRKAWELVQKVTGVRLKGKQFHEQEIVSEDISDPMILQLIRAQNRYLRSIAMSLKSIASSIGSQT